MVVFMLHNILKGKTDEDLLLLTNYFRKKNNEMFSERKMEGCFNTVIQRSLINNKTRF